MIINVRPFYARSATDKVTIPQLNNGTFLENRIPVKRRGNNSPVSKLNMQILLIKRNFFPFN